MWRDCASNNWRLSSCASDHHSAFFRIGINAAHRESARSSGGWIAASAASLLARHSARDCGPREGARPLRKSRVKSAASMRSSRGATARPSPLIGDTESTAQLPDSPATNVTRDIARRIYAASAPDGFRRASSRVSVVRAGEGSLVSRHTRKDPCRRNGSSCKGPWWRGRPRSFRTRFGSSRRASFRARVPAQPLTMASH